MSNATTVDIAYRVLDEPIISDNDVFDINRLLPQLSSSAPRLRVEMLYDMRRTGTMIFIARDCTTGHIVGTVLLVPMKILVGQKDWIEDVVVDQDYRRLGIASTLMDMAEEVSRQRGAKSVNLTSSRERVDARRFYLARGYKIRESDLFRITW
ncbi:MAG TPA: GNAT family N-acetyltransferase [Candidatus Saccharimonadales bacterium]|jgi:phosphinothricin acetyltransferase